MTADLVVSVPMWVVYAGAWGGLAVMLSVLIGSLIHRNKTLDQWDAIVDSRDPFHAQVRELSGLGPTYHGAFDWAIHDPEVAA